MSHILKLTCDDPVIHIKAYGGIQIFGQAQTEVHCEIDAPQLATLVEENGHVYVTINSSCKLLIPENSSIQIEKGMGSVKISNIKNQINIEKVLGNLVLSDIGAASIEKIGGNFSVRRSSGSVQVEKVAGSLAVEDVASFAVEKTGGNCRVKELHGDFHLAKAGGQFVGQSIEGISSVEKVGGSFIARNVRIANDLRVGGNIELNDVTFESSISLKAGGDIEIGLSEEMRDAIFEINAGGSDIRIKAKGEDLQINDYSYEYKLGEGAMMIEVAAGGDVRITDEPRAEEDIVGDLSEKFNFEESAFSEMIQERVEIATRRAETKIKSAQIRLEKMQEELEQKGGFKLDIDINDAFDSIPSIPRVQPPTPVARPVGKKGASDEERLMILKMLQDKRITVEEAETLFKALED